MSDELLPIEDVQEILQPLPLTADLIVAYSSTLIAAIIPIWIGAHVSLSSKSVSTPTEADKKKGVSYFNKQGETMSSKDAYMFPVIGSAVLFGLFLAFMLISKEYVNLILTIYFLGFGIGALTGTISPIFNSLMGKTKKDEFHWSFKPPWSKGFFNFF